MNARHAALLVAAGCLAYPASASLATDLMSVATRLEAATNARELDALTAKVEDERQAAVSKLLDLLNGKGSDAVKVRGCYLAGALGDLSVVNALIKNIELTYSESILDERRIGTGLLGISPCVSALVGFGPAIQDRIVKLVGNPESLCQRDQGLLVLYDIAESDGLTNPAAEAEVEQTLGHAILKTSGGEATRLQAALDSFRSRLWGRSCPIRVHEEAEAHGGPHLPVDELARTAERLRGAKSAAELDGVLNGVEDDRQSLLKALRALLTKADSAMAKARACYLLGQFHAPGDELFIANIDLEWEGGKELHPCRAALVRAWRTGSLVVMRFLAKDDDPVKREDLVKLMIAWYGGPGAAARLSEAMRRETARGGQGLAAALRLSQALTIAQGYVK